MGGVGSGRPRKSGARDRGGRLIRRVFFACACGSFKTSKTCARCLKCEFARRHERKRWDLYTCACGNRKAHGSAKCDRCEREARRVRVTHTCERCGVTFQRKKNAHDACRFCSRACAGAWRRAQPRKRAPRRCELCERLFAAKHRRKFCSPKCRATGRVTDRARSRLTAFPVPTVRVLPRTCLECDAEFVPTGKRRKYCSDRCARRMARRMAKYRLRIGFAIPPGHELFKLRRLFGRVSQALQGARNDSP